MAYRVRCSDVRWIKEGEESLPCWVKEDMYSFEKDRGVGLFEEIMAEE